MISKRAARGIFAALFLVVGTSVPAQESERTPERRAVDRAFAWLAGQQDAKTGAWRGRVGYKFNFDWQVTADAAPHVGATALAVTAFLKAGYTPASEKYGNVVRRGLSFLVSSVSPETGFVGANGTRMRSHAHAITCFAAALEKGTSEEIAEALRRAVSLTLHSQNKEGGWRFQPFAPDTDVFQTAGQILALQAARTAGVEVAEQPFEAARRHAAKLATFDRTDLRGFRFQALRVARVTYRTTAAGAAILITEKDDLPPLVPAALAALDDERGAFSRKHAGHFLWWQAHLIADGLHAAAAERDPKRLVEFDNRYRAAMSRALLSSQRPDGAWENEVGPGDAWATAIGCLILL